ncbi:MAG: GerW family sporulation protein, partial [Oscillospiraceae bacterium]|nr:GerW family sporulation protein [Oscillospiraceae bacterium]
DTAGDSQTCGGAAGAGVNITPVAFLIVRGESVRLLSVDPPAANTVDRVIDAVPEVVDKVTDFLNKRKQDGQSEFG